MLIRIPVPGVPYPLEFDSDNIVSLETPREFADVPGRPGERVLLPFSKLVLHFGSPADAPKWVDP